MTKRTTDKFVIVNILFAIDDSFAPKARAAEKKYSSVKNE